MRNEIFDRFCDGFKPQNKTKPENKTDYIDVPCNDSDIEGIYRYLGWHMYKAGMSSNCFHYLEILKREASKDTK